MPGTGRTPPDIYRPSNEAIPADTIFLPDRRTRQPIPGPTCSAMTARWRSLKARHRSPIQPMLRLPPRLQLSQSPTRHCQVGQCWPRRVAPSWSSQDWHQRTVRPRPVTRVAEPLLNRSQLVGTLSVVLELRDPVAEPLNLFLKCIDLLLIVGDHSAQRLLIGLDLGVTGRCAA